MENQQLSVKDILKIVKEYYFVVYNKIKIIIAFGLVLAIILGFKNSRSTNQYHEELTFMMDETKGSSTDITTQLLGGLFGGTGADSGLGKITRLFESRQIIHRTLFDSITLNNKNDYMANHFLEQYTVESLVNNYKKYLFLYSESWPKQLLHDPNFKFTRDDVDNFDVEENLYLRLLYENIRGNSKAKIKPKLSSLLDEDTGIMTVTMHSPYEDLTYGILTNIYDHLSEFFIEKSVEKQKKTYNIVSYKKDSITAELKSKEYQLANFKDSNRKLVTVKGYLKQLRLERDVQVLNTMYAEAVRQMELTDFTLRSMTPVVQIIDLPRKPIIPIKKTIRSGMIKGFLFGTFLLTFFFLGRKVISDLKTKIDWS